MQIHAYRCDAPICPVTRVDENEMITATVTIKATPGNDRHQFKVHACNLKHLGEAVALYAEV